MNRREFVAELLAALGGRVSTDETVQLTVAGSDYSLPHQWIYRAERRIATLHDFDVLHVEDTSLTTTADDYTPIDLPAYTKAVMAVRIIDGTSSYEVTYRPPTWFTLNRPNISAFSAGKPKLYTIKRKASSADTLTLIFDPYPDDDYTLYVDKRNWPSPMSSDTDVSDFGEYYLDHVILEYAIAFGFSHFGEAYKKDCNHHETRANKLLEEMIATDNYVPAYYNAPEGYLSSGKRRRYYDLDAGSVPDGTVSPWR